MYKEGKERTDREITSWFYIFTNSVGCHHYSLLLLHLQLIKILILTNRRIAIECNVITSRPPYVTLRDNLGMSL